MTDPTAIAKAWLGHQQLVHPQGETATHIRAVADACVQQRDYRPLANLVRQYIFGVSMAELTPEQKAAVNFDAVAQGLMATRERYARAESRARTCA